MQNNVRGEIRPKHFPEHVINQICSDIFGKEVGSTYVEGLIDAENEDVMHVKLTELKEKWLKLEKENSCHGVHDFYEWFCKNKVNAITNSMLQPV
jgi:hypothetical protein